MVKMDTFEATEELKNMLDEWGIDYPNDITYQEALDLIEMAEKAAMLRVEEYE